MHGKQIGSQGCATKLQQHLIEWLLKQCHASCRGERGHGQLLGNELAMRSRLDPRIQLLAVVLPGESLVRAPQKCH